ncbi:MAG TPA: antitoxin family protein [Terriglobia bacterium]|jgi:predicted DNA-binding antitoxin AbrB/MazE fold protein
MSIKAVYENGIFKPLEDVPLKEGTEVEAYPMEKKGNGDQGSSSEKRGKSLLDNPAFGMWKDYDEIGTGINFENRLRQYRK